MLRSSVDVDKLTCLRHYCTLTPLPQFDEHLKSLDQRISPPGINKAHKNMILSVDLHSRENGEIIYIGIMPFFDECYSSESTKIKQIASLVFSMRDIVVIS